MGAPGVNEPLGQVESQPQPPSGITYMVCGLHKDLYESVADMKGIVDRLLGKMDVLWLVFIAVVLDIVSRFIKF